MIRVHGAHGGAAQKPKAARNQKGGAAPLVIAQDTEKKNKRGAMWTGGNSPGKKSGKAGWKSKQKTQKNGEDPTKPKE